MANSWPLFSLRRARSQESPIVPSLSRGQEEGRAVSAALQKAVDFKRQCDDEGETLRGFAIRSPIMASQSDGTVSAEDFSCPIATRKCRGINGAV